jgi:hypothetical protein
MLGYTHLIEGVNYVAGFNEQAVSYALAKKCFLSSLQEGPPLLISALHYSLKHLLCRERGCKGSITAPGTGRKEKRFFEQEKVQRYPSEGDGGRRAFFSGQWSMCFSSGSVKSGLVFAADRILWQLF